MPAASAAPRHAASNAAKNRSPAPADLPSVPGRRTGTEGRSAGAGDRFFAALLAACRGAAEAASIGFPQLVYPYLEKEMSLATPIPLDRLCQLALVSRAGFYRWRDTLPATDADLDLRDGI